jgi:hypothetical protein
MERARADQQAQLTAATEGLALVTTQPQDLRSAMTGAGTIGAAEGAPTIDAGGSDVTSRVSVSCRLLACDMQGKQVWLKAVSSWHMPLIRIAHSAAPWLGLA